MIRAGFARVIACALLSACATRAVVPTVHNSISAPDKASGAGGLQRKMSNYGPVLVPTGWQMHSTRSGRMNSPTISMTSPSHETIVLVLIIDSAEGGFDPVDEWLAAEAASDGDFLLGENATIVAAPCDATACVSGTMKGRPMEAVITRLPHTLVMVVGYHNPDAPVTTPIDRVLLAKIANAAEGLHL
jgi:hypothetical protein